MPPEIDTPAYLSPAASGTPQCARAAPAGGRACPLLVQGHANENSRLTGAFGNQTPQPPYEVVDRVNGIEIRRYAPRVVAETVVGTTSFDEAREEGFRRLASYIFGENIAADATENDALSAARNGADDATPSEHIAMTAPVTLAASERGYVMRFLMPRERELALLPQPKDPRVVLRRLPIENFAVLRFRGTYSAEHVEGKERELVERLEAAGLQPKGEPTFAGYDAPSALPFLRRVEVWVGLA